jgi:hypothetical protein
MQTSLALVALALSSPAPASEISVPLRLGIGFFQHMALKKIFNGPDQTFVAWDDRSGCNHLVLSHPVISSDRSGIRLHASAEGRAGTPLGTLCVPLVPLRGEIEVLMKPSIGAGGRSMELAVVDSHVRDAQGHSDLQGTIWNWTKQHVHPRLASLRVDLTRLVTAVHESVWRLFRVGNKDAVGEILGTLALSEVSTDAGGVNLKLTMDVHPESETPRRTEPVLTASEMARLDELLANWDVVVTLAAKKAAALTMDPAQRDGLLSVLLDTRYEILSILETSSSGSQDPVRELFLDTWTRLAPLMKRIGHGIPDESALDFLAFISALDALKAIDAAAPGLNLDLSKDGLRRLVRLIVPPGPADPLRYDERVDPELRRLFYFGRPIDPSLPTASFGIDWLIGSAWAEGDAHSNSSTAPDGWIPTRTNIDAYLERVRGLLEDVVDNVLRDNVLDDPYRGIFHPLMLASAWQETCWRQFILEAGKRRPITSSVGAVGIMQVSPRVWRGFYNPKSLTWEIAYNATAGAEILHHYLVHYAIRKEEHKKSDDLHQLARATYSAYHGGPRHLTRYRKKSTPPKLKRIDRAFWKKYETIRAGNTLAVQQCYN